MTRSHSRLSLVFSKKTSCNWWNPEFLDTFQSPRIVLKFFNHQSEWLRLMSSSPGGFQDFHRFWEQRCSQGGDHSGKANVIYLNLICQIFIVIRNVHRGFTKGFNLIDGRVKLSHFENFIINVQNICLQKVFIINLIITGWKCPLQMRCISSAKM